MRKTTHNNGFTLVELLVALIVTSIVTTAVATLAYALNSASRATDDTSTKQAQVRFATLRISDLIRNCRLICYASTDKIAIWTSDTNSNNQINLNEVTYIEAGAAHDHLQLCTFTGTTAISLSDSTNWWSAYSSQASYTSLMPTCSNVKFYTVDSPPNSKRVIIAFDLAENGVSNHYQISGTLRARAANLLDASGNIISDDD